MKEKKAPFLSPIKKITPHSQSKAPSPQELPHLLPNFPNLYNLFIFVFYTAGMEDVDEGIYVGVQKCFEKNFEESIW